jgi:sarcosine oxidase
VYVSRAGQKFPVYIWDLGGVRGNFYGFPTEDNSPGEVKVAFHVTNSTPADGVASPEAVDREVHPAEVEAMRAVLSRKIPEMNNELIKTTTCMYTSTVDGHLYV